MKKSILIACLGLVENSLMAVKAGVKRVVITSADKIGTNEGTSIE